jgi:hypothetical protein
MLCNTDGKYIKHVILDFGADVGILNFNYRFNFWFYIFQLVISFFILICPGTCNIKGAAVG